MKNKYTLTVLIPAYNNIEQTKVIINNFVSEQDVKIVISDDSDDHQAIQLNDYIQSINQPNIIYIKRKIQDGAFANHNDLLNYIDSKYYLFAHLGETYENKNFLQFLRISDPRGVKLIILPTSICNNTKKIYRNVYSYQQKISYFFLRPFLPIKNIISSSLPCIIVSSEIIEKFNTKLKYIVDIEWLYRIQNNIQFNQIYFYKFSRVISHYKEDSITNLTKSINFQLKNDLSIIFDKYNFIIKFNLFGGKYIINMIFYTIFFFSYSIYYSKLFFKRVVF